MQTKFYLTCTVIHSILLGRWENRREVPEIKCLLSKARIESHKTVSNQNAPHGNDDGKPQWINMPATEKPVSKEHINVDFLFFFLIRIWLLLFLNKHFCSFLVLSFSLLSMNFSPPSIAPYVQSRDGMLATRPNTAEKSCRYREQAMGWMGWVPQFLSWDHLVSTEMELICYTKSSSPIRTGYEVSNQCSKLQCTVICGQSSSAACAAPAWIPWEFWGRDSTVQTQLSLQHSANPNQLLACHQWDSE